MWHKRDSFCYCPPSAGEPLLQALALGPDAWGSGKAMLDLTLRNLDPGQARAVLLLLFRHCEAAGVQCRSGWPLKYCLPLLALAVP